MARRAWTVVVVGVLAAGCSSSGDDATTTTGPGTTGPATTAALPTTSAGPAPDETATPPTTEAAPRDTTTPDTTTLSTAAEPAPPPVCPTPTEPVDLGDLPAGILTEASGIAAGIVNPDVYWVHDDSGGPAAVFALTTEGELVATVELVGATNRDWEDLAVGPGPEGPRIWVADIGDNDADRTDTRLYVFGEPVLDPDARGQTITVEPGRVDLTYADGPVDAETLLIDPVDGSIYVVEKFIGLGRSDVYEVVVSIDGTARVEPVARVPAAVVTGGDVRRDGSAVLLGSYLGASWWPRPRGTSLVDVLDGEPGCNVHLRSAGGQVEAFAFTPDGSGYVAVSEGEGSPMVLTPLAP